MSDTKTTLSGTFTKTNFIKTLKGALIAGTGAGALYFLNWLGALEIGNATLASLITLIVPVATNAVKELLSDR